MVWMKCDLCNAFASEGVGRACDECTYEAEKEKQEKELAAAKKFEEAINTKNTDNSKSEGND